MVTLQEIKSGHKCYPFVERLLHTAFPENERRDDDKQRWNTDNEERFHCLLIMNVLHQPVGLLTYWDFHTFIYIEHLAIHPEQRGKGIGAEALLAFFHRQASQPVVLEVEHPIDELSRRRIGFYERCGLKLWECDYRQPPYRPSDDWFPMYLMVIPSLSFTTDFQYVRDTLHREVYGILT